MREYVEKHWRSIHERTADHVDVYDYTISRGDVDSYTRQYVSQLSPIPGLNVQAIEKVGLPCIHLWSTNGVSVSLPLADMQGDGARMRGRLTEIWNVLSRGSLEQWQIDELEQLPHYAMGVNESKPEVPADPGDVFISYTRPDLPIVDTLRSKIEENELRPWIDTKIPCGERFRSRIFSQIRAASSVLICLTRQSVRSLWVNWEAELASRLGKAVPLAIDLPLESVPSSLTSLNILSVTEREIIEGSDGISRLLDSLKCRLKTRRA